MFKVGDRVKDVTFGGFGVVADINPDGGLSIHWDGELYDPRDTVCWDASDFVKAFKKGDTVTTSAVEDAGVGSVTEGPVRTVTRKEIVGGTYGDVTVGEVGPSGERVPICIPNRFYSAEEIRAAIATLIEIAEALE